MVRKSGPSLSVLEQAENAPQVIIQMFRSFQVGRSRRILRAVQTGELVKKFTFFSLFKILGGVWMRKRRLFFSKDLVKPLPVLMSNMVALVLDFSSAEN